MKIAILGSTGSIGKSTLEVIKQNKKNFNVILLSANNNYKKLIQQAKEFNVKSVLINIFGGITRCDLVANGIVEATKGKELKWPIIVRLDGTNSKEGLSILEQNTNEKITISSSMNEAAKLAVEGAI